MGMKGKESPESWEEVKRQWARDAQAGKPILRWVTRSLAPDSSSS